MSEFMQRWHALGEAPRIAILRCIKFELIVSAIMAIAAAGWYWYAVFVLGDDDISGWFRALGLASLLIIVAIIVTVCAYVLIYRAHRTVKQWLFSLQAPGYPSEQTWTSKEGWLLGLALLGGTALIPNVLFGVYYLLVGEWSSAIGTYIWAILGIVLPPIAARRFIPLGK